MIVICLAGSDIDPGQASRWSVQRILLAFGLHRPRVLYASTVAGARTRAQTARIATHLSVDSRS
jgi:hypothetical protein